MSEVAKSVAEGHAEYKEGMVQDATRKNPRPLTLDEINRMELIKSFGNEFISVLERDFPEGRERSLAKTKIEEAVMWAVKGLTG